MTGLLGRKIGMTQVFDAEAGTVHPVTVLEMGPCVVMQVRTQEKDGYDAVQLGFDDRTEKAATKAELGHAQKTGNKPKSFVREFRLTQPWAEDAPKVLTVDLFNDIKRVDVVGTMKGRGFGGVMKRHGFRGLETGHGVQRKHRAPGSIGMHTSPGRVLKGHRMNGQYGNCRCTIRNLKVVKVDTENNVLLVRGGVPGANGSYVMVRQTNKH